MIRNIDEAWTYYHRDKPGYRIVGRFISQSQHGGTPGPTHIISVNNGEKEYLTRKRYWANAKMCKVISPKRLPMIDRVGLGETIKTRMLNLWYLDLDTPGIFNTTHVTVMEDGKVYVFPARMIVSYATKFNSFCDHEYEGERAAVFYPLRLAIEFANDNTIDGMINRDIEPGQETLF